jgi:hypothetical protein
LSSGQTCRQESSDVEICVHLALILSPPLPHHTAPLALNRRSRTTAGWQPSTYANLAFRTVLLVGSSRTTSRPTAYPPPAIIAVSISRSLLSLCSLSALSPLPAERCLCLYLYMYYDYYHYCYCYCYCYYHHHCVCVCVCVCVYLCVCVWVGGCVISNICILSSLPLGCYEVLAL